MAEIVLVDAFATFGGADLSDHIRSITINHNAEILDKSAMSDTSRANIAGLKNWSVDVEFNQDYAATKTDATLFALVGTSVALVMRPDSGVIGPTNPEFTGNAFLESYSPIGGSIGEVHTTTVTFKGSGPLARAES